MYKIICPRASNKSILKYIICVVMYPEKFDEKTVKRVYKFLKII